MAANVDHRSPERLARDEALAAEPVLAPLAVSPETIPLPLEAYLRPSRRIVAVAGIVENGLVRPLDPEAKLAERSRVIIVMLDES